MPADPDPRAALLRQMARDETDPQRRHALMLGARQIERAFAPPPPKPSRLPDWYWLTPGWEYRPDDPGGPPMLTAAVLTCAITGRVLSGMGGPGPAIAADLLLRKDMSDAR